MNQIDDKQHPFFEPEIIYQDESHQDEDEEWEEDEYEEEQPFKLDWNDLD